MECEQTLDIGGQFTSELGDWNFLASTCILARPQRREIARASAFSFSPQGRDSSGGQGKSGCGGVDRAKLFDNAVHDSASGAACEKVRERRMAGGLTLKRGAMYCACGRFRTEQISRSNLYAGCAECHSSCNTSRIRDAIGSNDRELHCPHHLRQQCHRANLRR